MYDFETHLLNTARVGLEPFRATKRMWQRQTGQVPVNVLFYHRVANTLVNPWTISCSGFQAQIEWVVRHFEVVTLDECQRRIARGHNSVPTVAITFDDGYAENMEFAIPFLIERSIPFTYFVTLGNIVSGQPFQHDVAAGQPLEVNTVESIRALANCGVTIGAHTRWHPSLATLDDPAVLHDEVVTATHELSGIIGRPVRHFAFPFGTVAAVSRAGFRMALDAGIQCVCSASNGTNLPGDDSVHLARIHGDPCLARVRNWLANSSRLHKNRRLIDAILQPGSAEQGAHPLACQMPGGNPVSSLSENVGTESGCQSHVH